MLVLWYLTPIALWVTSSAAFFYSKNCYVCPDKIIPYCFESSVSSDIREQFKKATAFWEDGFISVEYDNRGSYPERDDAIELSKLLVVSAQDQTYMESTNGFLYPDNTGIRFQQLKIGLSYTPHYTTHRSKNDKFVPAIVHELGHVMCLLNENQRSDLKEVLTSDCANLIDYEQATDLDARADIRIACEGMQYAKRIGSVGALNYAPYPASTSDQYVMSPEVDYISIMLNNGQQLAVKGGKRRVIMRKGFEINGRDWSIGPSSQDKRALNRLWRNPPAEPDLPRYDVVDPHPPPGYDCS